MQRDRCTVARAVVWRARRTPLAMLDRPQSRCARTLLRREGTTRGWRKKFEPVFPPLGRGHIQIAATSSNPPSASPNLANMVRARGAPPSVACRTPERGPPEECARARGPMDVSAAPGRRARACACGWMDGWMRWMGWRMGLNPPFVLAPPSSTPPSIHARHTIHRASIHRASILSRTRRPSCAALAAPSPSHPA